MCSFHQLSSDKVLAGSRRLRGLSTGRVRYFWGTVSNLDQSKGKKICALDSDKLTLPHKAIRGSKVW